jgi:hypothetical protein
MGEIQSCIADVRVKRKEGGKIEIKVEKYKSLVDCLSVDEGGNGSESKSKKFKMLNWEGYVQQRWLSITMSNGKKYKFKLEQAIFTANDQDQFWAVVQLNESQDFLFDGVLKNVYMDLIEFISPFAEAPKKAPIAKYDSDKRTLCYSKDELGYQGIEFIANMVGKVIGLRLRSSLSEPIWAGFGDNNVYIYAKVASVSVQEGNVIMSLTTSGTKTRGIYAKEQVKDQFDEIDSGDYRVNFNIPGYKADRSLFSLSVALDIIDVAGLANGISNILVKPKVERALSFVGDTETIGSESSDNRLRELRSILNKDNPYSKVGLYVETTNGSFITVAIENLERRSDRFIWLVNALGDLKVDNINNAWISLASGTTPLPEWWGWK